jgi:hypothetical protein
MTNDLTSTKPSEVMDALATATEFIQCSIRALAWGAAEDSREVQQTLEWAVSKLINAGVAVDTVADTRQLPPC